MIVNQHTISNSTYQNGNPVMKGGYSNTFESNCDIEVRAQVIKNFGGCTIVEYDQSIDDITKHQHTLGGTALLAFFENPIKIEGTKLISSNTTEVTSKGQAEGVIEHTNGIKNKVTRNLRYNVGGKEYTYDELLSYFPIDNKELRNKIEILKAQYGFKKINGKYPAMPDALMNDIKEVYKSIKCYTPLTLRVTAVLKHTVHTNGQYISSTLTEEQRSNLLNNLHGYKQHNGRYVGTSKLILNIPISSMSDIPEIIKAIKDTAWKPVVESKGGSFRNFIEGSDELPSPNTWESLRSQDKLNSKRV